MASRNRPPSIAQLAREVKQAVLQYRAAPAVHPSSARLVIGEIETGEHAGTIEFETSFWWLDYLGATEAAKTALFSVRSGKQVEITAPDGITWRLRLSDIAA